MVTVWVIIEYNRIDDMKWSPLAAFFLPAVGANSFAQLRHCMRILCE